MKRKEIIVLLGEVLGSRAVYSIASIAITVTMLSGITIILRNDIRDIKNYVQSVVDGDPKYREIHEQVSGSENVIRGNIDIKALAEVEDEKSKETATTDSNISEGYDNYTPTQTVTGESSNKPSNIANNSSVNGETSSGTNSNNNHLNNGNNVNTNTNTNNSSDSQKEEIDDRSSFNGKDVMVSEGEPFNPMNALQLAATDINGKNITNKIVITENNVDTYKPGLYNVKAAVTLSDKNTLEKEFLVRVEPTILNLAINDLKTSKEVLGKNEHFNLSFAVKSSKSYLEVASVNINNKDYVVNKTSVNSFFRTSNKYEVDLVAPSKGGTEKIEIKSVTMSDGTIVDINKSINIKVLKEDAYVSDVVLEDKSDKDNTVGISFNLNDVDNDINEARVCVYNEENQLVAEELVLKDINLPYTKFLTIINLSNPGTYTIKILASKNSEAELNATNSYSSSEVELFSESINVNMKSVVDSDDENIELLSMGSSLEDKEIETYSEDEENNLKARSVRSSNETINGSDAVEHKHQISITGNVLSDTGEFPPGTFQVVVPTTASFTVNQYGQFITTPITIRNEGHQNIDVYAYKFIDVNKTEGINIKKKSEIVGTNRSNISLNVLGNQSVAYFKTEESGSTNSGVYKDAELSSPSTGDGINVLKINSQSNGTLTLQGEVGKEDGIEKPISDRFTLILKIKKSQNS